MIEEKIDKVTYCMTGPPPKNLWSYKADFESDMKSWGYEYTTLSKTTDMLIAANEELGTLKCKKAEKYRIPIYSYEDAFNKKERLYVKVIRKKRLINIQKNRDEE
jgi:hypothetical protein